jgi:hypothetical protein
MTEEKHLNLRAQITRWVSDDNPGIVECRFTDRFNREWTLVEKRPVVTAADIWSDSQFPQPAYIGCEIISRGRDDAGREIAEISTEKPWGMETTDGATRFHVFADQLTKEGN